MVETELVFITEKVGYIGETYEITARNGIDGVDPDTIIKLLFKFKEADIQLKAIKEGLKYYLPISNKSGNNWTINLGDLKGEGISMPEKMTHLLDFASDCNIFKNNPELNHSILEKGFIKCQECRSRKLTVDNQIADKEKAAKKEENAIVIVEALKEQKDHLVEKFGDTPTVFVDLEATKEEFMKLRQIMHDVLDPKTDWSIINNKPYMNANAYMTIGFLMSVNYEDVQEIEFFDGDDHTKWFVKWKVRAFLPNGREAIGTGYCQGLEQSGSKKVNRYDKMIINGTANTRATQRAVRKLFGLPVSYEEMSK